MNAPGTTPQQPVRHGDLRSEVFSEADCGLCGEPCDHDPAMVDAAGYDICPRCLEDMLDASTFNARAEVGLVGSGGGRS